MNTHVCEYVSMHVCTRVNLHVYTSLSCTTGQVSVHVHALIYAQTCTHARLHIKSHLVLPLAGHDLGIDARDR